MVRNMEDLKKGIKFDATINLGHILTFIGFILSMLAAWQTLDKRIVVLEEGRHYQELRDNAQDAAASYQQKELQDTLEQVRKSIEKLDDKLDHLTDRAHGS